METVQALKIALDVNLPAAVEEAIQAKERAQMACEDMQMKMIKMQQVIQRQTAAADTTADHIVDLQTNVRRLQQENTFLGTELDNLWDNWEQETNLLERTNKKLKKQLMILKARLRLKRRR